MEISPTDAFSINTGCIDLLEIIEGDSGEKVPQKFQDLGIRLLQKLIKNGSCIYLPAVVNARLKGLLRHSFAPPWKNRQVFGAVAFVLMLGAEAFTTWKWFCSRHINKCVIIAGGCLKWQGKDCLQTTASEKHSSLSNEDILITLSMSDMPFWLLFLQPMLSVCLCNRISAHPSLTSVLMTVDSLKRLSSVL